MNDVIKKILDSREENRLVVNKLFNNDVFVITLNLNIPGLIKKKEIYKLFFTKISKIFISQFSVSYKILDLIEKSDDSGFHLYITIDNNLDYEKVKKSLIEIENKLGYVSKYIDFDLLISKDVSFSRRELSIKERKCFLCDKPAKICSRNQTHKIEELINIIDKEIKNYLEVNK